MLIHKRYLASAQIKRHIGRRGRNEGGNLKPEVGGAPCFFLAKRPQNAGALY